MNKLQNVAMKSATLSDKYFAPRIKTTFDVTIPDCIQKCKDTGRVDAFKLTWKPGDPKQPHIFWDSDFAKVVEGLAYQLLMTGDSKIEKELNEYVDLIVSAQQPDGYLNTAYTVDKTKKRWSFIASDHELYCAGHLMEAAVAHYEATGNKKFLDAMVKYADYIDSVFGLEEGKLRGYPGHQEIELALVRLADATGNRKYMKLAKYFIDQRGHKSPHFFVEQNTAKFNDNSATPEWYTYNQAHKPVREQEFPVGHAVRATYMYSGMADVAYEFNDTELLKKCEQLFDDIATKLMYITGGLGSRWAGEAFAEAYCLPNRFAYAESCASIALVFFASRMFNITGDGKYMDVLEKIIYNGALSGISISGDHFLYQNPLEVSHEFSLNGGNVYRVPWFSCSCCPTNYCRFIPQLASYCWSENGAQIRMNIPASGVFGFKNGVEIEVNGAYPYDGNISLKINKGGKFDFLVRIPSWCTKFSLAVNGKDFAASAQKGYVSLGNREWKSGEIVSLIIDMSVEVIKSNDKVYENAGRVALTRGPIVYAIESVDNKAFNIFNIKIPIEQQFEIIYIDELKCNGIAGTVKHAVFQNEDTSLYAKATKPIIEDQRFIAIPYALWDNRGDSQMLVWIPACYCKK